MGLGTDSCNKLTVSIGFQYELTTGQAPDCVEVRFKTEEKSFIAILKINLSMGDIVATVASPGHDIELLL
jgi:hypothetical protein